MKTKTVFAFLLFITLLIAGCDRKLPQKVEYPHYAFRNTISQELVSVERTYNSTILSFKFFGRPEWWILVPKEAYLTDGKARYALKGAEGITPGEYLPVDDDGNAEYKLIFEPIPSDTKDISFIEAEDDDGAFNFYHIDLSGKEWAPLKVPANLSESLPEIELKSGESRFEVRLPCSLKGLQPIKVSLYVNNFFPPGQNEYTTVLDESGFASFSFEHNGPARALLVVGDELAFAYILINPGETVTATVDGSGRNITSERFSLAEESYPSAVFSGSFAALNTLGRDGEVEYTFNIYNGHFAADAKSMSDYARVVFDTYTEKRAALDADESLPTYQKEYLQSYITSEAVSALSYAEYIRGNQYQSARDGDRAGFKTEPFSPEDLSFLKDLDLNNPRMLLLGDEAFLEPTLNAIVFPERNCLQADYSDALLIAQKVLKGSMPDDKDMAVLESLSSPFFKDCIVSLVEANIQASKDLPDCVKTVPDVADDKLLETILSKYKGQVVLIDLWATWCSPCRAAHRIMEPLKDNRFKDVSFVYFTSTTSPLPKWREMIDDIRGDHYYFTDEQLGAIFSQIESRNYPTYLIVGRDGEIKDKFIGFDDDVLAGLDEALR